MPAQRLLLVQLALVLLRASVVFLLAESWALRKRIAALAVASRSESMGIRLILVRRLTLNCNAWPIKAIVPALAADCAAAVPMIMNAVLHSLSVAESTLAARLVRR